MASYPDILITSTDSPNILVAVETRLGHQSLETAIRQLRHYMVNMSCPVGLLVLPDEMYIYRNRYTGTNEESVERIGQYQLGTAFQAFDRISAGHAVQAQNRSFESFVQHWLERLPWSDEKKRLPPDLKDALESHVLPAIESGIVRAAGPRDLGAVSE